MINTHELKLPLSRTYFYGSKGVRAIEAFLYQQNGSMINGKGHETNLLHINMLLYGLAISIQ